MTGMIGEGVPHDHPLLATIALVQRFPKLELAGQPVRRDQITLRGLSSLPLSA
jgi:hypothetical protein